MAGTEHPYRLKGAASHTTPVTVAAELGPLGAIAYGWLLGALVWAGAAGRRAPAVSRTLLAALVAIFASSLFYNSFFEDPTVWLIAGLLLRGVRVSPATLGTAAVLVLVPGIGAMLAVYPPGRAGLATRIALAFATGLCGRRPDGDGARHRPRPLAARRFSSPSLP